MKKHLLALALPLPLLALLVACTSGVQNPDGETSDDRMTIDLQLQQTTAEDAQAVPHTTAQLVVGGPAIGLTIDLPEITGTWMQVNPAFYVSAPGTETVAVLTSWFAGAGDELRVTSYANKLLITHMVGDESGACTEQMVVTEVDVPEDAVLTFEKFGDMADQSSLAFCNEQIIQFQP